MEPITLLKRGNDQQEGTVVALQLYQCRRNNLEKSGEAIQLDMSSHHSTRWIIPCTELRRVGVNYINVLDRIVDVFGMWWQPESGTSIVLSQFDNYTLIDCLRVDPNPNDALLLGIPGIGLPVNGS